jgi:3-deoxy-manno-octulosonate cytidylyltransferase (CMP-KDO synthetase)
MKIVGVIPVRMGSSRFPGKPLVPINGIPMVGHVLRRAELCRHLDEVVVTTCDREIADYVAGLGRQVVMTSAGHERCTDRVAEAVGRMADAGVVVVIQGDEPMLRPEMIEVVLESLFRDRSVLCANLMVRITSPEEAADPNVVKVVVNREGLALYFSRTPVPYHQGGLGGGPSYYKQVCIMPFTRKKLLEFSRLPPTPLEMWESIDMLRALEHGHRIRMSETGWETWSVDTPDDLEKVATKMAGDPLVRVYGREFK